jgi:hypothetical protein
MNARPLTAKQSEAARLKLSTERVAIDRMQRAMGIPDWARDPSDAKQSGGGDFSVEYEVKSVVKASHRFFSLQVRQRRPARTALGTTLFATGCAAVGVHGAGRGRRARLRASGPLVGESAWRAHARDTRGCGGAG